VFPLHLRTVLGLLRRSGGSVFKRPGRRSSAAAMREVLDRIPNGLVVAGGALFVACWASGMSALWELRDGGPATSDGRFYRDNHGALTPVSEAEYHNLQLAEQRVLASICAAFYVISALYNYADHRDG
jgi:diadenosine tetraphosphatase ApaH/serine/threonine PP2A family protein phosphatase